MRHRDSEADGRDSNGDGVTALEHALHAAAVFAVDPIGVGGVHVIANAGPVRAGWLDMLTRALPAKTAIRRVPLNIADDRLFGGLDLAATLQAGRPVAGRGLLAEVDNGIVLIGSAERCGEALAARLAAAMDQGRVVTARDGLRIDALSRFGVIAFDESQNFDEAPPAALRERLGLILSLDSISPRLSAEAFGDLGVTRRETDVARARLAAVTIDDTFVSAIAHAADAIGVSGIRALMKAVHVARINAALEARDTVNEDDVRIAAALVLALRATRLPEMEEAPDAQPPDHAPPPDTPPDTDDDAATADDLDKALADRVEAATAAAIPAGLLAQLKVTENRRNRSRGIGKAGDRKRSLRKGRPMGARRGELNGGARLNVVETLRAAAPWQPLRRREAAALNHGRHDLRVHVRKDDFRVTRFSHRAETVTVFLVDASGSAALNRLAECKGAIELLLADCYVRRDQVAMVSFRGTGADIMLPPTRSLARAKRSLAGLPGGGGTPLATGLDTAGLLIDGAIRRGQTATLIVLTDGRANIDRDGKPGRPQAEADGLVAARQVSETGVTCLVIDTSPRPAANAKRLADAMGGVYLPLPYADSAAMSDAVKAAAAVDQHAPARYR